MAKVRLIDANERLKLFFGQVFDMTRERIAQAARHGVSQALNAIRDKTKSNISSNGYFNGTTSAGRTIRGRTYNVPLIEGVNTYMIKGEPTGFVDILGTPTGDDGTWRLRFFENGTKQRKSKNGRSYGALRGTQFFNNAYASIGSDAVTIIQNAINSAIDEINNKEI